MKLTSRKIPIFVFVFLFFYLSTTVDKNHYPRTVDNIPLKVIQYYDTSVSKISVTARMDLSLGDPKLNIRVVSK